VTQGEADPEGAEKPDGSVGRYVRDQWNTDAATRRALRRPTTGPTGSPTSTAAPPPAVAPPVPPARRPVPAEELRPTNTPPWGAAATPPPTPARTGGGHHDGSAAEHPGSHRTTPPAGGPTSFESGPRPVTVDGRPGPLTPPRGTARWIDPGAVAAQEAQRARSGAVGGIGDLPADLSSARLLRPTRRPPQSGWRRLVYVLSGRLINPGESPADVRRRELIARVNAPLLGCHKIALLSLKGGVGKTTMTATLGATFASLRGDRVVAVDANPDRGTLSQKIPLETSATVRHLLRDAQRVRRYTDVRAYTSQGTSRLEVLASEQDPAVSVAFSEDDYRRTVTLLEHFYNMVLTDCGTGLMHSAMYGVLGVADQIVVVSSGSIDGARSASATMDWLDAHGHGDLVRNAVAVINCVSRSAGGVDLDRVAEHFGTRCRAVVRIPFDAHLQEGAEVDLDRLEPRTRLALLELAAEVADAFPS
jgi:MinD-like ATPase involved in chromosome partitioning or flagellar assembly